MIAVPNCLVSILRTPSPPPTDEFGDPMDIATVAATGRPASIIETRSVTGRQRTIAPRDERINQIKFYIGRMDGDEDVQSGDRVKDERTGAIYTLDFVTRPDSLVVRHDVRLELRRVF